MEANTRAADRLVVIDVDSVGDKLSMVKTEALVVTLAYRIKQVGDLTVCYTIAELDAEALIYAQADRQQVVEKKKWPTCRPTCSANRCLTHSQHRFALHFGWVVANFLFLYHR